MPETLVDYYALLGVDRAASEQEIREAISEGRRKWSKRTSRPELEKRQEAELRMRQLKEASEKLLDPAERQRYDQQLMVASAQAPPPVPTEGGDGWLELARSAMGVNDYRTAVRAAQEAQPDSHARTAEVWNLMARANAGMGRHDDAIFEAQRALQLEPDNHEHHYTLAEIFEELGDWSNAWRCYEHLARLEPDSMVPRVGMGSVCVGSGDFTRAVELFEELYRTRTGEDRRLAGDYLAMALTDWAGKVPQVQDGVTYTVTSQEELTRMWRLLTRATEVTRDPEIISGIRHHLDYVAHLSGRTFIWERLIGRGGCLYLVVLAVAFVVFGAAGAPAMSFLVLIAATVALGFYAWVPRWKVNRYVYYGGGVPY